MQYYKEHLNDFNDNSLLSGIYKNIDNISYIEINKDIRISIENNRAIYNDDVYYKNNIIVGIKKRNILSIVGILYLDSKMKYGSIKDKLYYLFKPSNKSYPIFYIPYKIKNFKNKIYCVIEFKEWKVTDKNPIGTLVEIIGNVGDRESEFEHLLLYYEIKNKNWKINNKDIILFNLDNIVEDYEVFSIDPIGSKDIDDAFHFKNIDENIYEIGIHIASPVKYFENDYLKILDRVSTVYLPNKKYNMLPNIYANDIISLLENKKRYAISLILKIDNNKIISYEIKETIVKNIKNYDYDNFDKEIINSSKMFNFISVTKFFFELNNINSHMLVEYWMIYTNKCIAKYLIDNNFSNIILRIHENTDKNNKVSIDKILLDYLNIKEEKSALYVLYDEKNKNQYHSKLGNEFYTHFTSPIRRSIDFHIHMLLLNKINNLYDIDYIKIIDKINIFTKKVRKFDRMIKRLDFLYNIKKTNDNIETFGYIIKITKNKLTLYIPEYNLEEKAIIVPYSFENIYDIDIILNNNNNINKITITYQNINKIFTLYEKINIKLWIFVSFENIFDKIKIEIL